MATSTIQFITQTKLAELSRQRDSLFTQYQKAETQAAAGESVAGIVALYEGLKEIRVGHLPLHRNLPNLAVLLRGIDPPEPLVAFWREQLERELQRGRLRADVVYLFGAFLGEQRSSAYSLDLAAVQSVFEGIDALYWNTHGYHGNEPPFVSVEGIYEGRDVFLRVLSAAPAGEKPGMKFQVAR